MKLNGTIHNKKVISIDTIPDIEDYRNHNYRHQIPIKPQMSISNDPNRFVFLILVIVIYLILVIGDLEFFAET